MKCKYLFLSVFIALMAVFSAKAQEPCGYFEDFEAVETVEEVTKPKLIGQIVTANQADWLAVTDLEGNKSLQFLRHGTQSYNGTRNAWYQLNSEVTFDKKLVIEYDYYAAAGVSVSNQEQSIWFLGDGSIGSGGAGTGLRQIFNMSHVAGAGGRLYFATGVLFGDYTDGGAPMNFANNHGNATAFAFVNSVPEANKGFVSFETGVWYTIKAEVYSGDRINFTVKNKSTGVIEIVNIQLLETFSATDLKFLFFNGARNGGNIDWNCRVDNLCIRDASEDTAEEYTLNLVGGAGAIGAGKQTVGSFVTIDAGEAPAGYRFVNWTANKSDAVFGDVSNATTIFTMLVAEDVTVTANFELIPASYMVTVVSEGAGASESGEYEQNTTVTVTAGTAPAGKHFVNWTSVPAVEFDDATALTTTFTMPTEPITVTANFELLPTFMVTVTSEGTGATASGEHPIGATVSISAGTPPAGMQFKEWTSNPAVEFKPSQFMPSVTFTMPESAIEVIATFEEKEEEEVTNCYYFDDFEGDPIGQVVAANVTWLEVTDLGGNKSLNFYPMTSSANGTRNTWYQLNDAIEFDADGKLVIDFDYYVQTGINTSELSEQSIWFLGNGTISGGAGNGMSQIFNMSHVGAGTSEHVGRLYFTSGVPLFNSTTNLDGGAPMNFASNHETGSGTANIGAHAFTSRVPDERKAFATFASQTWFNIKAEVYSGDRVDFTVTNTATLAKEKFSIQLPESFSATDVRAIYFTCARSDNGATASWNCRMDNLCIGAVHEGLCIDPMPGHGVTVRQHPSMKLSWKLPEGVTVDGFEVYTGVSNKEMTKVDATINSPSGSTITGSYNITYTPAEPFTSGKVHYWRVDAIVGGEIIKGTEWKFTPVTLDAENLVDIGIDYDGVSTTYTSVVTGVVGTATTYVAHSGTNKQATFTRSADATNSASDAGVYLQGIATATWRFPAGGTAKYIDVSLTSETSALRDIKKFVINGTDAQPNGTARSSPVVVFSDKETFDETSITGYQQVTLGICRTGGGNGVNAHRGQAATIVNAPAGSKSVRVYSDVKLSKSGNKFAFNEEGDIILTQANQARIAYIGVELSPSASDNTIREMSIENRRATINHNESTVSITLAAKGVFTVEYMLSNVEATADFVSGSTWDFTQGPLLITVTAGDGTPKVYTIDVAVPGGQSGGGGGPYKIAMVMADVAHTNATSNVWTTITQGYDQKSHERFMEAFTDHDVVFFNTAPGTKTAAELLEIYADYDLIIIHPTIAGGNAHMNALKDIVGKKPILNLKSFTYNSGRWAWGTATNSANTTATHVTVKAVVQTHPIFSNLIFDGEKLTLYTGSTLPITNALSGVALTESVFKDWNDNGQNHTLASLADGTSNINMHELNLDNAAKYVLFSVSTEASGDPSVGAFQYLHDNAIQLLRNAINYLGCSSVYYDYGSGATVDACSSSPVICDFYFDARGSLEGTTYTEQGNPDIIKIVGTVTHEPTRLAPGHADTDPACVDADPPCPRIYTCEETSSGILRFTTGNDNGANPTGTPPANYVQITFEEPVSKLKIYAMSTSGNADVRMRFRFYKIKEDGEAGDLLWPVEEVQLPQSSEGCYLHEKEDIDEPFIVRISRYDGGGSGILRVYAERKGAAPLPSDDATLKSLKVTQGTLGEVVLTPAFDPEVFEYTAVVPARAGEENITITVVKNHSKAALRGDGKKDLVIGENKFEIEVQAEDLVTKNTYHVNVTMLVLQQVVVTFDAAGGSLPDGQGTRSVMQYDPIGELPVPNVYEKHRFDGWFMQVNGVEEKVSAATVCFFGASTTAITIYAKWSEELTITFNPGTGASFVDPEVATRIVYSGEQVGVLPAPIDREGYKFEGWLNPNGSNELIQQTFICVFSGKFEITFDAKYTVSVYTVSFNSNGAGQNPGSVERSHGQAVGTLPPMYEDMWPAGKQFVGWFDNQAGTGTKWTAETPVTATVTLWAIWEDKPGPVTGETTIVWDDLKVYPNPAVDLLYISGLAGGELISIFDSAGRCVLTMPATGKEVRLSIDVLPTGAYFVKITKDSLEKTVKLIVN